MSRRGASGRYYGDAFRRFVLELREQHADLDLEHFADAVMLPLGTLKEWLAAGVGSGIREDAPDDADAPDAVQPSAEIQVVLASWKRWHGTFGDFCKHVREEQRVSFGPSLISNILFAYGKRRPRRRAGRSPDERALRGAFETFFGGAQWVGDGSPIAVTINDERFVFNLELMVDAYSGGFVGMSIRDEEDSAAVTEALADGVATTDEAPLAVLLDNRPSNHTTTSTPRSATSPSASARRPFAPKTRRTARAHLASFSSRCPRSTCAARPCASSPRRSSSSSPRPGRARSTTGRATIAAGAPA